MAKNFPNLMKIINPETQGTQQTPSRRNMKKMTPRHIIIKFLKISDKENILTAAREKGHFMYRETKIRLLIVNNANENTVEQNFLKTKKKKMLSSRDSISGKNIFQKGRPRKSLVVQWLGLGGFTAVGPGSIPSWGTKIPQAAQHGQKKKEGQQRNFRYTKVERGASLVAQWLRICLPMQGTWV